MKVRGDGVEFEVIGDTGIHYELEQTLRVVSLEKMFKACWEHKLVGVQRAGNEGESWRVTNGLWWWVRYM